MGAIGRLKRLCHIRAANMGAEEYRGASLEAIVEVLDVSMFIARFSTNLGR